MIFFFKDGFLILLDGIIEFCVILDIVVKIYVIYNEVCNDSDGVSVIVDEIIEKVIMLNVCVFCCL